MRVTRLLSYMICLVILAAFVGCAGSDVKRSSGEYMDDGMIAAKVKTDLAMDKVTKASQIEVGVYKGVVQLSGFVDSKDAIPRATEIAKNVKGVQAVKNDLILR